MVAMPSGPASMAAVIRQQGHQVTILDLCFEADVAAAIIDHVTSHTPELVAISLRQTDNNELFHFRSYLEATRQVVETVRGHCSAPIIIGGAGFTLFPEELLGYLGLTYGICGDGEPGMPLFVHYLQGNADLASIPGICYQDGEKAAISPPARITDFSGLPFPAYDLINLQRYLDAGAGLTVEGRRGCDLSCTFCPEGTDSAGCRLKAPELVVDEMQFRLKEQGIRRFFFPDGVFNVPRHHALAICQELKKRKLKVKWSADINPIAVDREMVAAMKAAGCRALSLGIDTASPVMLRNYCKGFTRDDIRQTAALLHEVQIPFAYSILFGGPGETRDTAGETLQYLQTTREPVFFRAGIRIFKGTALEKTAPEAGVIAVGQEALAANFYLSPELGPDFMPWLDEQCQPHDNWFTITRTAPSD